MYNLNCLALYFRFFNDALPTQVSNLFQISEARPLRYPTSSGIRESSHLLANKFARTTTTESTIGYILPKFINNAPVIITNKCSTHSLVGFKRYIKNYYINQYDTSPCSITNCYACRFS